MKNNDNSYNNNTTNYKAQSSFKGMTKRYYTAVGFHLEIITFQTFITGFGIVRVNFQENLAVF